MKSESSRTTRFIKDGHIVYSSGTLYYQRTVVRGYLYKLAESVKLFQMSLHYKRFFVIDGEDKSLIVQDQPDVSSFRLISADDMVCL